MSRDSNQIDSRTQHARIAHNNFTILSFGTLFLPNQVSSVITLNLILAKKKESKRRVRLQCHARNSHSPTLTIFAEPLLPHAMPSKELNLPGTSAKALVMLPIRVALWAAVVSFFYPIFLIAATLRALYLKLVYGPPSKILKYGTHNAAKWPDFHYPAHVLFDKTLDETKLKDALVGLCAEDGITAEKVEVVFHHVPPNDWAENGSWPSDHYHDIIKGKDHGFTYWDAAPLGKGTGHGNVVKVHVFNAVEEGKPTLMFYVRCAHV